MPKSSTGASVELAPGAKQQSYEVDDATKTVTWLIRKFPGGSTQSVSCKFVTKSDTNVHKEMGPVSLAFEIPMYNISQLQVQHLRIVVVLARELHLPSHALTLPRPLCPSQVQHLKIVERNKSYNPHRWVRCLTHAESYICRIGS